MSSRISGGTIPLRYQSSNSCIRILDSEFRDPGANRLKSRTWNIGREREVEEGPPDDAFIGPDRTKFRAARERLAALNLEASQLCL